MIRDIQRVVVIGYHRAPTFELAIPGEVFSAPAAAERYSLLTVAGEPHPLRTAQGWAVPARRRVHFTAEDVVIVAGWRDVEERPGLELLRMVDRGAAAGAHLVSLCIGAFVLAAAGILDNLEATTHWRYARLLADRHPQVVVNERALFVETAKVSTSAGTVAGVDLCVQLIRRAHGAHVANDVARQLVLGAHRDGDQAQFIAAPVRPDGLPDIISLAMRTMRARLGERVAVPELAAEANLSTRQFVRRFQAETGTTPYRWLLSQRVLRARELLETEASSIEEIATHCGFRDAAGLRMHFGRTVGTTPTLYRRTFGSSRAPS